jgi:translation initiation factor IF-1
VSGLFFFFYWAVQCAVWTSRRGIPTQNGAITFRIADAGGFCYAAASRMEEHIEVEGKIMQVLAGTMFRVELDNKHQVLATISGKMRKKFVKLTVGDRVKMQMSQYDLNKARIVWRIG